MGMKVDFRKMLPTLYHPSRAGFHYVDVPGMNFLLLAGTGNPATSSDYHAAVEALYAVSYRIKFALKPAGFDYVVPPLEGLWWMDDMSEFTLENKYRWKWDMMIMQPDWVTGEHVEEARTSTYQKKHNPAIPKIRFERFVESLSLQILYTGAYVDEAATIEAMHQRIREDGYVTNGKHHEIYLSDPRKIAPGKLRTILRQPVTKR